MHVDMWTLFCRGIFIQVQESRPAEIRGLQVMSMPCIYSYPLTVITGNVYLTQYVLIMHVFFLFAICIQYIVLIHAWYCISTDIHVWCCILTDIHVHVSCSDTCKKYSVTMGVLFMLMTDVWSNGQGENINKLFKLKNLILTV